MAKKGPAKKPAAAPGDIKRIVAISAKSQQRSGIVTVLDSPSKTDCRQEQASQDEEEAAYIWARFLG